MPMENDDQKGTDGNWSKSEEYCVNFYKNGEFTSDVTMDEMINISLKHMKELFKDDSTFNEEEALAKMNDFFLKLKRWKS